MAKRRGRVMYGLLSSEEKLDFALRARTSTAKVRLPSGMFATAAAPSQQGIDGLPLQCILEAAEELPQLATPIKTAPKMSAQMERRVGRHFIQESCKKFGAATCEKQRFMMSVLKSGKIKKIWQSKLSQTCAAENTKATRVGLEAAAC